MRLLKNLEALLAPFPVVTIHRIAGRLLVFLREGTRLGNSETRLRCDRRNTGRRTRVMRLQVRARVGRDGRGGTGRVGRSGRLSPRSRLRLAATGTGLRHRLDGHEPDHRRCVVRSFSRRAGADEEPRCHRGSRGGPERIVRVRPLASRHRGPAGGQLGQSCMPSIFGYRLARSHLEARAARRSMRWRAFLGSSADFGRKRVSCRRHRARTRTNGVHCARVHGAFRRLPARDLARGATRTARDHVPPPHVQGSGDNCAPRARWRARHRREPGAGCLADP